MPLNQRGLEVVLGTAIDRTQPFKEVGKKKEVASISSFVITYFPVVPLPGSMSWKK
jgi:hypothetical protein